MYFSNGTAQLYHSRGHFIIWNRSVTHMQPCFACCHKGALVLHLKKKFFDHHKKCNTNKPTEDAHIALPQTHFICKFHEQHWQIIFCYLWIFPHQYFYFCSLLGYRSICHRSNIHIMGLGLRGFEDRLKTTLSLILDQQVGGAETPECCCFTSNPRQVTGLLVAWRKPTRH